MNGSRRQQNNPQKPIFKERLRIDLRNEHRWDWFAPWTGRDMPAQHCVHDPGDGSIVLSFSLPVPREPDRADVVLQSHDRGKTWGIYEGPLAWPPANRGIYKMNDGRFQIALAGGTQFRRSDDCGRSWRGPFPIPSADYFHFAGLGMPNCFSAIMLRRGNYAGRIVLAADYFLGQEGPDSQVIGTVYSDDWGESWKASRLFWPPDPLPKAPEGFGEPAIVEMPSGWLWMAMRSVYGELWQAVSRDGGASWCTPGPTGFASPIANCYAISGSGNAVILAWNLAKPDKSLYYPRTNLVFAVSRDNCRTWTCPVIVEPLGGFYPTLHCTKEDLFILYQSSPDPAKYSWAEYGLTLVAYDLKEIEKLPAWTTETIQPYIEQGLVAQWLGLACRRPREETIT